MADEGQISVKFTVSKAAGPGLGEGFAAGWAYRTRDEQGRPPADISGKVVLSAEELDRAGRRFMVESQRGDILHQTTAPARLVQFMVVTDEIAKAMKLPDTYLQRGLWVGFQFDTSSPEWARVQAGELPEFSWQGRARRRVAA